jgi:succinoglycan biosynthesis protein ExoM
MTNPRPNGDARTSIAVYVATYRRNEPLARLLESILVAAEAVDERAAVGMIVVDDNPDGAAKGVVDRYEGRFELGIHYRHVGLGNISLVRNLGLEAGIELGEWVAMTDDDCVVSPQWLSELLAVQRRTSADAVTGPCELRLPEGSPSWLTDQPFLDEGLMRAVDGAEMPVAATHNSMVSSDWFRRHPEVRFDPDLGVLGGEDMVMFRTAARLGLRIHFSAAGVVYGHESADRTTLRYRLRINYWLGNTECVTNLALGSSTRPQLLVRGIRRLLTALARPFGRLAHRQPPQWRFGLALIAQSAGLILGALGVRRDHH